MGSGMILEVQHETVLSYSLPVTEATAEARMEPVSDGDQSCHFFHLGVSPPTGLFRYQDGFGNQVHHFNHLQPHHEVTLLAASVVESHPRPRDPASSQAVYPPRPEDGELDVLDFLRYRAPISRSPGLEPLLERLAPRVGQPIGEIAQGVAHHIHEHFEYAPAVTLSSSPIDDVLEHGKGVCQDFTHLMIALLRGFGIPARYVSGYLHRPGKESQSHAWCEVWLPDLGWIGIDPTNDCPVNERFIKVAVGRDFTDVPPNKGIFRGNGKETISVRVETRELERVPPLSWREKLPPLHVPLTTILTHRAPLSLAAAEAQQQ